MSKRSLIKIPVLYIKMDNFSHLSVVKIAFVFERQNKVKRGLTNFVVDYIGVVFSIDNLLFVVHC